MISAEVIFVINRHGPSGDIDIVTYRERMLHANTYYRRKYRVSLGSYLENIAAQAIEPLTPSNARFKPDDVIEARVRSKSRKIAATLLSLAGLLVTKQKIYDYLIFLGGTKYGKETGDAQDVLIEMNSPIEYEPIIDRLLEWAKEAVSEEEDG